MDLAENEVKNALKDNNWTFMNKILYQMCSKYPEHTDNSVIMAKICIIGRSYSASIERRKIKDKKKDSDDYYGKEVAPAIKNSNIDKWLNNLKTHKAITSENIHEIIKTHAQVMKLFSKISGLNKRSLASKYLHFHMPNLFYIYDGRAIKGLNKILPRFHVKNRFRDCDVEYSRFFQKMFHIQNEIKNTFGVKLSTRQLDRLLLLKP